MPHPEGRESVWNYKAVETIGEALTGADFGVISILPGTNDEKPFARNYLTLMASRDLVKWDIIADLYDFRDRSHLEAGVQYVQLEFEGDDIIYVCRTALNKAHTYHDSNYITFHRIKDFRKLVAE